jgi:hypothetical protein
MGLRVCRIDGVGGLVLLTSFISTPNVAAF